jgi:hypothetical protein
VVLLSSIHSQSVPVEQTPGALHWAIAPSHGFGQAAEVPPAPSALAHGE